MLPRALRFMLFGLEIRRWRLCATPALILPVAVREKRFLAPLLVFIWHFLSFHFKDLAQRTTRHARLSQLSWVRRGLYRRREKIASAEGGLAASTGRDARSR